MSRHPGQHARIVAGYEARHAKPGMPGPAALLGAAAKAVPVSLVAGTAGSALALSAATSAAATVPAGLAGLVNSGAADLVAVKTAIPRIVVTLVHHKASPSAYTVISGDTLSGISARFCGTTADYLSLAASSGIANPDVIYPGQAIKLDCDATPAPAPAAPGPHHPAQRRPGRHSRTSQARPASGFSTAGMAAFETCVIARESGGNPRAVNPVSGAGGLFQFLPSTWAGLGYAAAYPGGAQTAPAGVQEDAFAKLYAIAGPAPWGPYDGC